MKTAEILRQVLSERGIRKRELARMIVAHKGIDGDRAALENWERAVYRWTSEENPGGMDEQNAELVAAVLALPPDTFKTEAYYAQLADENRSLGERVDRIEALLDELQSEQDDR